MLTHPGVDIGFVDTAAVVVAQLERGHAIKLIEAGP